MPVRGAGQLSGEIARVGAQRDLPSCRGRPVADGPRQRGQRPGQQPHHVRAGVLVPGQQVGGQRDLGLRPRGHVRPARPLPLVVIGHPAFLAAVHLHVGGVDVDRHRPGSQLGRPLGGKQVHHPRGRGRQARPGPPPVHRGEPAYDPGRGRGRQPGHRHQLLPRLISAHPVQPDQEILPSQLGRGHPGQHLPAGEPPRPLLDRPDALIQRRGQAELAAQLGHRDHPAGPVSDGSAAPIWILPRVLPGIPAASTISVTLLLGQSSTVTLDDPSRTPQSHTYSAACRRSSRGNRSDRTRQPMSASPSPSATGSNCTSRSKPCENVRTRDESSCSRRTGASARRYALQRSRRQRQIFGVKTRTRGAASRAPFRCRQGAASG